MSSAVMRILYLRFSVQKNPCLSKDFSRIEVINMFCTALDLHKENTYDVLLDEKTGQCVGEGNFASAYKAAKEVLEPFFVRGTKIAIEATSCFYPMYV